MKENTLKAVIAVTLAGAMTYLRELAIPVAILALVMAVDYISGMVRAWVKSELSSRVGIIGIVKKVSYLLGVVVAIVADWVVMTAAAKIGVDFGGFYFFGLLVTVWLILNECISILENISEIGVPLPAFLLKLIEKLKKTVEDAGDQKAE
ncbi:MAG: phage holin family protein [Oscillospiraceae bacterium]|nr:phage holin family protein [Clostridium lundense]MBQ6755961.1 phage holin family protein [Oscillospiraceae bacterium]MBR0063183.1 phage holin family protein [Oscillospiraceae bacterium]